MFIERVVEEERFIIRYDLVDKFNKLIFNEIGLILDPIRTLATAEPVIASYDLKWKYKMVLVVSLEDEEPEYIHGWWEKVENYLSTVRSDVTIEKYVDDVKSAYINSIDPQGNIELITPAMISNYIDVSCYNMEGTIINKVREMFFSGGNYRG